jgi:steroid delta-isomerase-like uncharacterized protein
VGRENEAVVRDYIEHVWNARELDLFERYVAADAVHHDPSGDLDTRAMKLAVAAICKAFPDHSITIDDAFGDGDRVVLRQTLSGTLQDPLFGMPATGKHASWVGIYIYRLADGKIVEIWGLSDNASMMQQLGLLPAPAASAG